MVDSEDEDGWEDESQGLQPLPKRPRVDDGGLVDESTRSGDAITGQGARPADDIAPEWLKPKVATTYGKTHGKKTTSPPKTSTLQRPEQGDPSFSRCEVSQQYSVRDDGYAEPSCSPSVILPSPGPMIQNSDVEPLRTSECKPSSQNTPTTHGHNREQNHDIPDSDEDLPDPSQFFRSALASRPVTPARQAEQILSAASSPLSELPESPEPAPYPGWSPVRQPPSPGNRTSSTLGIFPDGTQEVIAELQRPDTVVGAGANRRRSLRARTEKQLHPYEYEYIIYQRECRQRGIRPVHYRFIERKAVDSQDRAFESEDGDRRGGGGANCASSQSRPATASSEGAPQVTRVLSAKSSRLFAHQDPGTRSQNEDSSDVDATMARKLPDSAQDERKRRKLVHIRPTVGTSESPQVAAAAEEWSIPPSPPPTSSESPRQTAQSSKRPVFRYPRGHTPRGLPTPQVSSEMRPSTAVAATSDSDSPPRRPRSAVKQRAPPELVSVSSDSEVEHSVTDVDAEQALTKRAIERQRRRIRGVLPASWLKIDLKAQQRRILPSPGRSHTRARRHSTASPHPSTRQLKGVAQRISRPAGTAVLPQSILTSDDGDDDGSASESGTPLPQPMAQARNGLSMLHDNRDDDPVEVDWIDPMFAGSSRGSNTTKADKKHQPRIPDAFRQATRSINGRQNFSEEPRRLQYVAGEAKDTRQRRSHTKTAKTSRQSRPSAPRLSILDLPEPPHLPEQNAPQFVRLARRQARRHHDRGRHSPGHKILRLATENDTRDAGLTLKAWREGIIVPAVSHQGRSAELDRLFGNGRPALADATNVQQGQLPLVLRKGRHSHVGARLQARRQQMQVRQIELEPAQTQQRDLSPEREDVGPEHSNQPAGSGSMLPQQKRKARSGPANGLYRKGQLESLETAFEHEYRAVAFERRIACLTEAVIQPYRERNMPIQLKLYMDDDGAMPPSPSRRIRAARHDRPELRRSVSKTPAALPHRSRKRPPQRIDTEARQYRQPNEPLPDDVMHTAQIVERVDRSSSELVLQGLGSFDSRYATDFDIQPLPLGTYFQQSTFIGSGDFAAALRIRARDLSLVVGRLRVHVGDEVFEWGPWTEEVSAGIAMIPWAIENAMRTLAEPPSGTPTADHRAAVLANVDHMLRSVVRYCSSCLAFLDPIDRKACVQRLHNLVETLLDPGSEAAADVATRSYDTLRLQYALVIATQMLQLTESPSAAAELAAPAKDIHARVAQALVRHIAPWLCGRLRASYESNRQAASREAGIRDDCGAMATMVVLSHCTQSSDSKSSLWSICEQALTPLNCTFDSVAALDRAWYDLYTIQPALELDAAGISQPGSRFRDVQHDWTLPKKLVARLLECYPATSKVHGTAANNYIRATLTRCYLLMSRWGWWRCEAILVTVFDFFAQINFGQLHSEPSRGSPAFLDMIETHPSLEVLPDDRSFHILLKMLATGLLNMRKHSEYTDKKVGGIAWRFIPNHGRRYPKDIELKQEDLDALRNHYDLLCTLYYASPPGHRLRVELLRNLVDHADSHCEACRLSVQAWTHIASFQMSTGEPAARLEPLTSWYRETLHATMVQFRLAKTEAERDFAAANQHAGAISEALLKSIISANQRQLAATLIDALAGLKRALRAASNLESARALLEGCAFWTAFVPFDASEKRLLGALNEALDVVEVALHVGNRFSAGVDSHATSDDSQDYGDISGLQELASTAAEQVQNRQPRVSQILHEPLAQLLSNVFGADRPLDDGILSKLVDIWTNLVKDAVLTGKRAWSTFINGYDNDAWQQLRGTSQKRLFAPYFLSRILCEAGSPSEELKDHTLSALLISLVEREARLKHEHLLLAAVLNHINDEPLLDNLPVMKDRKTGQYSITLHQLRQRRLGVLSSMLANMRQNLDETTYKCPRERQELRRRYTILLRALMQAMRSNFLELQDSSDPSVADSSVQGAYVDLVHQVVSYLQQYTTNVCRIDTFFTDSNVFPLPSTDPTYVVGRLKSYVPRLMEVKIQKQLAGFVYSVSERAAVDGPRFQDYFVDQLCTSMLSTRESGNERAPSLGHVLLTAVFPCYIKAALDTPCSWILALPILRVCGTFTNQLLYDMDLNADRSVEAAVEMLTATVSALSALFRQGPAHAGLLRFPWVQRVLKLVLEAATSALTPADYLKRCGMPANGILEGLGRLTHDADLVAAYLSGQGMDVDEFDTPSCPPGPNCWTDTRHFAEKQLHDSLRNDWRARDGQYFVRRGNTHREVVVPLGDEDEEAAGLMSAAQKFLDSHRTVMSSGQARRRLQKGWAVDEGMEGPVV